MRITGTAVVLLAVAVLLRPAALRPPSGRLALLLVVHGLVGVAALQWTYFVAIDRLPVGLALLLEYQAPLLVVVWARFVQHEQRAPAGLGRARPGPARPGRGDRHPGWPARLRRTGAAGRAGRRGLLRDVLPARRARRRRARAAAGRALVLRHRHRGHQPGLPGLGLPDRGARRRRLPAGPARRGGAARCPAGRLGRGDGHAAALRGRDPRPAAPPGRHRHHGRDAGAGGGQRARLVLVPRGRSGVVASLGCLLVVAGILAAQTGRAPHPLPEPPHLAGV